MRVWTCCGQVLRPFPIGCQLWLKLMTEADFFVSDWTLLGRLKIGCSHDWFFSAMIQLVPTNNLVPKSRTGPKKWFKPFLGDLNLEAYIMYNVWWWESPIGIKRLNLWIWVWKCSICLSLVMFGFFIHFRAVVDAQSVKKTNFCFYVFLWAKNQYGWHGEIWVWLYKWLYSSEMVDICWWEY